MEEGFLSPSAQEGTRGEPQVLGTSLPRPVPTCLKISLMRGIFKLSPPLLSPNNHQSTSLQQGLASPASNCRFIGCPELTVAQPYTFSPKAASPAQASAPSTSSPSPSSSSSILYLPFISSSPLGKLTVPKPHSLYLLRGLIWKFLMGAPFLSKILYFYNT